MDKFLATQATNLMVKSLKLSIFLENFIDLLEIKNSHNFLIFWSLGLIFGMTIRNYTYFNKQN